MKADIIVIGDEILIGQITDTNSGFMAKHLNDIGIELNQITAITDDKDHIILSLERSLEASDIVLITGGLGPTNDDITKYSLAEYFNTKLVHNESVLENIKELLSSRNNSLNKQNLSQAMVPENCIVLNNRLGTAPAMFFKQGEKMIFSMPGVPFEMKAIFTEQILPIIEKNNGHYITVNKTVIVYNIPEAMLAEKLEEWEDNLPSNFGLAYLPSPGLIKLRLTAKGENRESLLLEIENQIAQLSKYIPIEESEISSLKLEERLSILAKEKKISLSTAESCTGGYIAHLITSISGSSSFFKGSIIAYSNEIKEKFLNVHSADIDAHGAVSQIVVEQMAKGVRTMFSTDYTVSTSGIAGPDGGTEDKPVGTVWIAVASKKRTISRSFILSRDREYNIIKSANLALDMLYREIAENE